ncbi:MAG: hypothetical protein EP344_06370 [Bacteroidetes bacterium]|nr:MAG: hypothetical protein EP344_06370 [Bacteroidota bacterium]
MKGCIFISTRLGIVIALALAACGNPNTPLDAGTRRLIDSTSAAQIRIARDSLDSLCQVQHTTVLPLLVDSIKQKRLHEIEQQLKSIPK